MKAVLVILTITLFSSNLFAKCNYSTGYDLANLVNKIMDKKNQTWGIYRYPMMFQSIESLNSLKNEPEFNTCIVIYDILKQIKKNHENVTQFTKESHLLFKKIDDSQLPIIKEHYLKYKEEMKHIWDFSLYDQWAPNMKASIKTCKSSRKVINKDETINELIKLKELKVIEKSTQAVINRNIYKIRKSLLKAGKQLRTQCE